MYARPRHQFMRHALGGFAVMRRFTACVALAATQAPSQTLRPTHTFVCTRHCHAQGGRSSSTISNNGLPLAPQPHSLVAVVEEVMRTVLELWQRICNEAAGNSHITTPEDIEALEDRVYLTMGGIACSSSFVAGVQKGVFKFYVSESRLSLIRKGSNSFALMTASVHGWVVVFVHASVAAVDPRRARSILSIPTPPPPPGCIAQPPWRIYCVPNFTTDMQDVAKAFQFALNGGHESPLTLTSRFPSSRKLSVWKIDPSRPVAEGSTTDTVYCMRGHEVERSVTVHVAASIGDWETLESRHCNFLHSDWNGVRVSERERFPSTYSQQPVYYDTAAAAPGAPTPPSATLVSIDDPPRQRQDAATATPAHAPVASNAATAQPRGSYAPLLFTADTGVTQLFSGDAGTGKTTVMLVGRCNDVDLVVYVCVHGKSEVVTWNTKFVELLQRNEPCVDRDAERRTLTELLATLVKDAVGQKLHESLCAYDGAFRVRLVFDEVGSLGEVVRALCGQGSAVFHELLGWGPEVSVYLVAGGTGVGAADAACSSQLANYHLTRLEPQSTGVLWERMKVDVQKQMAKAVSHDLRDTLANVLQQVSTDVACRSARCNPRLAALMIARCWNMAIVAGNWHLLKIISSADIRCRILVPVAERYKSLTELSGVGGHAECCELLVSALCYALFAGFRDRDARRSGHLLSQKYGVLVDNAGIKERGDVDPQRETIALDDSGRDVEVRGTGGVVCFPTAKGHYSISPAMVVVLQLLAHMPQLVRCEGDTFEAALAHMLYIAVQVYQGRPVVELLRFVFGEDAVSTSITTSLEGKAVTYTTVALRCNRTELNEDTAVPLPDTAAEGCHQEESCGASTGETPTVGTRASIAEVHLGEPAASCSEQQSLWTCEVGAASVEVSPTALPSAGVVLHIPGVLTLPVVCKDVGVALLRGEVEAELDAMVRRVEKTNGHQTEKPAPPQSAVDLMLVDKLAELGGVVVPVLLYTRSGLAAKHRTMKSAVHDVARVIFADGLGEDVSDEPDPDPRRQRLHEARLVRRSMFPFTLRQLQDDGDVVIVDACSAW